MRRAPPFALGLFALALALAGLSGPARAQPIVFETPLSMADGWAVVTAHVNGRAQPLTLVVDSGASASVLDQKLAASLGVVVGPGSEVQGAQGATVHSSGARIGDLEVGGAHQHDVPVVLTDMGRFSKAGVRYDGILGGNFLFHYSTVFDVPAGTLSFYEAAEVPGQAGAACVANTWTPDAVGWRDFEVFGARLGGAPVQLIVDTGSQKTQFNLTAGVEVGLRPGHGLKSLPNKGTGYNAAAMETRYDADLPALEIGGATIPAFRARVGDLDVFKSFALFARPAGLLGIDLLSQRRFAITRNAATFCLYR
jgi:Aspartyl protease